MAGVLQSPAPRLRVQGVQGLGFRVYDGPNFFLYLQYRATSNRPHMMLAVVFSPHSNFAGPANVQGNGRFVLGTLQDP